MFLPESFLAIVKHRGGKPYIFSQWTWPGFCVLSFEYLQKIISTWFMTTQVSQYVMWDLNMYKYEASLQWRHNGRDGISNHRPHDYLPNRLFRRRSKKTSKLRVNDLCEGNSPVTDEFPSQMASHVENVFIGWRHHVYEFKALPIYLILVAIILCTQSF